MTHPEESADATVRALIERTGFFDPVYYRGQRDDLRGVRDLLGHYLEYGWREGLNPSSWFDTANYLAMNDDVAASGMNPLLHFVAFGQPEGRLAPRPEPIGPSRFAAVAPSPADWAALVPRSARAAVVDVIVPVFRGFAETMRCLYSVLAAPVTTSYELIVIDDASPEPELSVALGELAGAGHISLVRNEINLGFTRSANGAFRLHPERDVVLLNADAEVFGDWLDRLRATARGRDVGTVTPFSNNGQICSYPWFMRNNERLLEIGDAELDALAAEVNRGESVELPTAVGFCTYLRRRCLRTIGPFDEARFPRGYGEENDFSRRAARAGWRNVLAADVFVRHHGATSFGADRDHLASAALERLEQLHPGYGTLIRTFVGSDPLRPFRERIDVARLRRARQGRRFLLVSHSRGGGTERHVGALADRIRAEGNDVLFLRAVNRSGHRVRFESPVLSVPNLRTFDIPGELEAFAETLNELAVAHMHIHHLADLPSSASDFMRVAARRAGIAYDVTIHDYLYVCPRINLIDHSGFYCGEPEEERGCTRCMERGALEVEAPTIWEWRDRGERLLRGARAVFVPDGDVAERLGRYFPGVAFLPRPHSDRPAMPASRSPLRAAPNRFIEAPHRRRVGVIGALSPHKGSRLLLSCARDAVKRGVPIDFVVIGYGDCEPELREAGVTITGAYTDEELSGLIDEARLDVAWFASVWPETFSYTLSAALAACVFPVAFDLGAIAARLRRLGWGHVMPLAAFFDVRRIVDTLASLPIEPLPALEQPAPPANGSFVNEYYGLQSAQ